MAAKTKQEDPTRDGAVAEVDEQTLDTARPYWCGAIKKAPFQNVNIPTPFGSVDFFEYTNRVEMNDDGEKFVGAKQLGVVAHLTDAKAKAALKAIENRVVVAFNAKAAVEGKYTTYKIRRLDDKTYVRDRRNETPLGKWLYMAPVDDPDGFNRMKEPAPIAQSA